MPIEEKELTSDVIIRITKEDKFSTKSIEDTKNVSLKNLSVVGEGQKLSEHQNSKHDKGSKSSLRGLQQN